MLLCSFAELCFFVTVPVSLLLKLNSNRIFLPFYYSQVDYTSRDPSSDSRGMSSSFCCFQRNCESKLYFSSFYRGRRNTYHHTSLLKIEGVQDTKAAEFYFGKRVAYIYKAQKAVAGSKFRVVWGKITRSHGSNGVVRAKFTNNLNVSVFLCSSNQNK